MKRLVYPAIRKILPTSLQAFMSPIFLCYAVVWYQTAFKQSVEHTQHFILQSAQPIVNNNFSFMMIIHYGRCKLLD